MDHKALKTFLNHFFNMSNVHATLLYQNCLLVSCLYCQRVQ